jgi:FkbM family methyltransferase
MRLRSIMAKQFNKFAPDWLFVPVYNKLLSKQRRAIILKVQPTWLNKECYLIKGCDLSLYSPTPKFFPYETAEWERKFEKYFKIQKGWTCVDIGACIGDTAIPLAMKLNNTGKLIVVEPDPINAVYLQANLQPYHNVEIMQLGIWKEPAEIVLHTHKAPTGHSIIPNKERNGTVKVQVRTLDDLFWRGADFAKIDIQGAELYVFEQAGRFLHNTNHLIVEAHNKTRQHGKTHGAIISALREHYNHIRYEEQFNLVYAWRV